MTDFGLPLPASRVRALIDGRMTQLRLPAWRTVLQAHDRIGKEEPMRVPSLWQRVQPGDRLWCREAHYVQSAGYRDGSGRLIWYRASDPDAPTTWTPSIHMPRWASRLTLTVTEVRRQRLQEIRERDCIAEGAPMSDEPSFIDGGPMCVPDAEKPWIKATPRAWFRELWDSLHGAGAWDSNPEVVALTFSVERRNIDAAGDP